MCYLSAATAIGLSWQCQFAELRSVQQTTTEPLPYVSLRRHKESRPPLPQLPLQSTQQQLLLKDGRRSVGVDSCDDDGSSIIPIMFSSPFFTKSQTQVNPKPQALNSLLKGKHFLGAGIDNSSTWVCCREVACNGSEYVGADHRIRHGLDMCLTM
jgi:hypothetical protein